ncbi:MAG: PstS family phosphate ABC transporter substrate-binding protein [Phycisphaeraceae bacterium]
MNRGTWSNRIRIGMAAALVVIGASGIALAQAQALRGKVAVDGSSTVYPVTEAAAAAFRKDFPNVNVTVAISGTGGGFKRFVTGETDISDASRPITPKEFSLAKENGIRFIEIPVALDGLTIVLNPQNDWVENLTVEQLYAIYAEDGKARKWSDLNPAWPNQPIKVYSPGSDSGTFDYFREVVIPKGKSFRSDMSTSEDDNVLVTGVTGDKYSIGYFGASYYFENKSKLKAAPIVNPKDGKAYLPNPEDVVNGNYAPFSRPLFIYVNLKSLQRPEVRKFVEFYSENAAQFAQQVKYDPVPASVAAIAKDFLKGRRTGSTYVTKEGEKRDGGLPAVYKAENLHDTQ